MSEQYPEHEKLKKVSDRSHEIFDFLHWLGKKKGIVLAEWGENEHGREELFPTYYPVRGALAEFFQIDLYKIEQEKRAMLDSMRGGAE